MVVLRQPDHEAFSEFASARSASLFRTAYLVIGDYQLAQDLVQESLVKTYLAWPRLRDVAKAEAYTRRVIVTTCISWRRRRSFSERPATHVPDASVTDPTTLLPEQGELWTAVGHLPPRQRAAVVLRFCEDLSQAQTAELMGCSVGSVKRHTSLALDKLRAEMGARFSPPFVDEQAVTP
ncbi:SigE family RNA polymerase sigma factor [Nocardioides guangzhouensis]|uniref:SigE family RNA polymerase sigma factor n=1 Tax=Nocardioides guangzhouensis TaxID=2497878 RepID=A0A4Q4ZKR8_9ACTN|nr:SigE family RNA polymerase sigma factor [Nocardioides guangzhouensis]RYP88106.1 SigE family RNA polymerase sigma factor [Nocardioides guangzhouensis]